MEPLVGDWELTPIQAAAWPVLSARESALLLAPTGHGKTEAAILPVLQQLLRSRDAGSWPTGFKVLYVTPLRALNRDLLRRLEEWGEQLGIRIGVRHGDTSQAERAKQSRDPPDILITTPETVQLLLYGDRLRSHLATVRTIIVDEVHDLAASERGAQLMVAIERIEEVIGQPVELRSAKAAERTCPREPHGRGAIQRIGLSATVAHADAVAAFIGAGNVVSVDAEKEIELDVVHPELTDADHALAGELSIPVLAAAQLRTVRAMVADHERVLVFSNTRDGAEVLASRSALIDDLVGLHHGSLSSEHRQDTEEAFRDGRLRGLVATSSLELGIDVGAIDHVVQLHSPRSVARMVQRLGRAGHRLGAVSRGTLLSSGPEDHLECVAVAELAHAGHLEPAPIREAPLVVLANQLIALANEYADLDPQWARQVIMRAGPFGELDDGMFQACWDTLIDVKTVHEGSPGRIGRSGRARKHFLGHVSLIRDEKKYRIFDEAAKRSIGTVDDAYVAAALHPGDHFVMAGRPWRVLEVDADDRRVRVAPTKDLGAIPQWAGEALPVSHLLAQTVARLRDAADTDPRLAPAAATVLAHRNAGLAVPTDRRVTLDTGRDTVVACVALGTRGNEALARITAGLLHQRTGDVVGFESDAYRIHFRRSGLRAQDIEETWRMLESDTLDLLLAMVLRDQPVVKHHLVHVAKHFGAVPDALDPNRFTRAKMDELWDRLALQEETLSRLIHERFDIEAVRSFLAGLEAGRIELVHQGMGPLSRLAGDEARMLMAPRSDEKLLHEVRRRIEGTDVMLVCTQCRHRSDMTVADVPRRVHCRRCGSDIVACLRPYQEEELYALGKGALDAEGQRLRKRFVRNGQTMAGFGYVAACCLAARGVGPDTAARILQKVADPESPRFWREVLQAELDFAQTSAHWR